MAIRKIVVNKSICSGCRLCEVVCSEYHEEEINPALTRIIITKNEETGEDIPGICEQCADAPCAVACPVDCITFDDETYAWLVENEACIECGLCVTACPFNAIHMHPNIGVAYKCDHCGGAPECVRVCELSALTWELI